MKHSHSLPLPATHPTSLILTLLRGWGAAELSLLHLPKATARHSIKLVRAILNSPRVTGAAGEVVMCRREAGNKNWKRPVESVRLSQHSEKATAFGKSDMGTGLPYPGKEPQRAAPVIANNQHRSQWCRSKKEEKPVWKDPAHFEGKMRVKLMLEGR